MFLVLLDGVQYRLYLLNAEFRRIMLFFTSLTNQVLFEIASLTLALKVKTSMVVVSASPIDVLLKL